MFFPGISFFVWICLDQIVHCNEFDITNLRNVYKGFINNRKILYLWRAEICLVSKMDTEFAMSSIQFYCKFWYPVDIEILQVSSFDQSFWPKLISHYFKQCQADTINLFWKPNILGDAQRISQSTLKLKIKHINIQQYLDMN